MIDNKRCLDRSTNAKAVRLLTTSKALASVLLSNGGRGTIHSLFLFYF
jgi:hypothetical protein